MIELLKPIPQVKPSSMTLRNHSLSRKRQWAARSLDFDYECIAVPVNDSTDQYSLARGVVRRLLLRQPDVDPRVMRRFRFFVRTYLRVVARQYGLRPLDRIMTFDEWVAQINHPDWRKDELKKAYDRVLNGVRRRDMFVNKFHGKIEHLEGPKENRGINARVDEAKVQFGPAIASIETEVYSRIPEFVKHIPVCKLAKKISEECTRMGRGTIIATDYTSFEGHFSPQLIRACEGQLYSYMLGKCAPRLARLMVDVISGVNVCQSPLISFNVAGVRMSGDMMTSLGNGFTNLMIIKFLSRRDGFTFKGFVEGDDGLFLINGTPPTPEHYEALGFRVKMETFSECHEASFCGQVFDADTGDLVVDPIYTCLTIGWTLSDQKHGGPQVMRGLLRSKALSLAYSAPKCPVVASLARCLLRLTRGVEVRHETFNGMRDWWNQRVVGNIDGLDESVFEKLLGEPTPGSRDIMEKVFGVDVQEQLELEQFFDGRESLGSWTHPVIEKHANPVYRNYHERNYECFPAGTRMDAPFHPDLDHWDRADVRGRRFRTTVADYNPDIARDILDPAGISATWSTSQRVARL